MRATRSFKQTALGGTPGESCVERLRLLEHQATTSLMAWRRSCRSPSSAASRRSRGGSGVQIVATSARWRSSAMRRARRRLPSRTRAWALVSGCVTASILPPCLGGTKETAPTARVAMHSCRTRQKGVQGEPVGQEHHEQGADRTATSATQRLDEGVLATAIAPPPGRRPSVPCPRRRAPPSCFLGREVVR